MIRVLSIFGTRPEAIKMAPLVKRLEEETSVENIVCVTAQHREMLDQVLEVFGIEPDFDLNIMKERQTLSDITVNALSKLYDLIGKVKPDIVLVQGDTTTTFVGALAAFYRKIPVGHVEAGLRTSNRYSPFPEEINRRLTSVLSTLHFAPTKRNKENLLRENTMGKIYVTGNTVIDALKYTVKEDYRFEDPVLRSVDFSSGRYILLTSHRRENIGKPLVNICRAVKRIVEEFEDVKVIYPVHMNPAVREIVFPILEGTERVILIDPVNVIDMHNLMARCYLIMTDSGGIQEEAPALGKPVVVLRKETERPEAIEAGVAVLGGVEEKKIFGIVKRLLTDEGAYQQMAKAVNPFGDGRASKRIVKAILHEFGLSDPPEEFN
ncbi:non-hydrolyzing UDP-N-acetylglucosamine 2-epimerase [Thermotoga sp.]|uniref:non-hydrolyzing UDP-N-acetylglucosamine 2-epimerase n=1 Tax=Thermotoga sp. TaxID=28240 RepID=UPI0025E1022B|nr:UDP-N-acetylglucosamine 2-epimerase (non-hydrolyzing) [Thermotoga sp.]MCD6551179.1 UDP-N-acetylglucosamine 2-epimerase (non-hydrolyzing) [Thermotoga sp.]